MLKLKGLYSDLQDRTEKAIREIESSDHPIAILLQTILREQLEMIKKVMLELSNDGAELKNMTEFLTIIYHDNEIANPTFRAWKRAVEWMSLPYLESVRNLEPLFQEIKTNLENAAAELERIYGAKQTKYIIPSFYLSALR